MIDFTVVPDGGEPYKVTATTRDLLQWEKTNKGKSFSKLMEDLTLVDLYQAAWIASLRLGHFTGSLAEFEASVELDFEAGEEPDPTKPAPSAGG